uniref:Uncharacterized protein n=1 Tax=Rhizophora mucronata TaxID=61149 RepID=A0A2P2N3E4_RHIMU
MDNILTLDTFYQYISGTFGQLLHNNREMKYLVSSINCLGKYIWVLLFL